MPKKSGFDSARLNRILQEQHSVVSRAQVIARGMSRTAVKLRIAPSGPWQPVLPGVYLAVTGGITQSQKEMAALLYGGPTSLITGAAAVRRHRLRSLRAALAEVADGVRSVAEADFRVLILRSDLPRPVFNARLIDVDGTLIAVTDAWWQEAGVAAEIDSRAYHLAAADQERTTGRHDKMTAHGILALHFSPRRVKDDPAGILREIRQAIGKGLERPPLPVKGLPPDD